MQTRKIAYFLAYQNTTKKWSTVSKSALENLNSPSLHILPVYTTGEHGEQTTWGEYQAAQAKEKEARQKPQKGFWQSVGDVLTGDIDVHINQQTQHEKQASNNITVKPQKESSADAQFHEINITMPLVRKSCRLLFFLFYLNLYLGSVALGLLMASSFNGSAFFGVLGGLAIAAILHFVVSQVVSDS